MENNNLITYDNKQLQKAGKAIAITKKLLEKAEPKLIPYRKGNLWGFCKPDKCITIPCVFYTVSPFSEGFAMVVTGRFCGFIDKTGNLAIPSNYDWAFSFSDGMASVEKDDKWGFINKKGELVIPCIYDSVTSLTKA